MYVMKLIGMKNIYNYRSYGLWNWKLGYVTLATIQWTNFGLVIWWTSKLFKELVLVLKCNNEIKIEMFWFILNVYEL
jgi:hypothetical protein